MIGTSLKQKQADVTTMWMFNNFYEDDATFCQIDNMRQGTVLIYKYLQWCNCKIHVHTIFLAYKALSRLTIQGQTKSTDHKCVQGQ